MNAWESWSAQNGLKKGSAQRRWQGARDSCWINLHPAFSGGRGVSCWDIPPNSLATVAACTSGHGAQEPILPSAAQVSPSWSTFDEAPHAQELMGAEPRGAHHGGGV